MVVSTDIDSRSHSQEGDFVILYFSINIIEGITLSKGQVFQSKLGTYPHDQLINQKFGSSIVSSTSKHQCHLLRPTPELITMSLQHRTQILYHTDIATIIQLLGLHPGMKVIEAGTGSGSLTTSLARAVAPQGKVFTCEFHEKRFLQAKEEFKTYGISHIVHSFHQDVCKKGFPDEIQNADGCFLDLPEPWVAIPHAHERLRVGGKIVTFSPCIEQVARNCEAFRDLKYHEVKTVEVLAKPLHVKWTEGEGLGGLSGLPKVERVMSTTTAMRGHTGYLTVATKCAPVE